MEPLHAEFIAMANARVWCSAATLDRQGRLRSRVLHPIWEADGTGWIATGRTSLKAKHLAANPYMSLCYMQDPLKPLYVDCHAEWVDDAAQKARIVTLFKEAEPPMGYDVLMFFGTLENPELGLLRLTPWRVELGDLFGQARVWRPGTNGG